MPVRQTAGLGDADMERMVASLGQALIGGNGEEQVRRLHRDLEVQKILVFQQFHRIERTFDQGLGTGLTVALQERPLQAAGVDAHAHRATMVLGCPHDLANPFAAADVAWIEA